MTEEEEPLLVGGSYDLIRYSHKFDAKVCARESLQQFTPN